MEGEKAVSVSLSKAEIPTLNEAAAAAGLCNPRAAAVRPAYCDGAAKRNTGTSLACQACAGKFGFF